jgi:transcriptional regulator with XRE-family HTH domain
VLRVWNREIDPKRLRQAREWSGIGSRELCRRLGQKENYISKIETGKVAEVSEAFLDELAEELAGKHLLKSLSKADVLSFFDGEIDLVEPERSLMPVPTAAPSSVPRGADPRDIRRIERLDKEEAPAETGTSETPSPASAGSHDQMS